MDALLSGQLLVAALAVGSAYALVALGLNLIYGTMRLLNVAHGEIVMLGAYIAYWAFTLLDVSPLVSMFAAMALMAAFGAVLYRVLIARTLRSTRLLGRIEANSLLLFFGVSVILQNLMSLAFSATPRGYATLDTVVHLGGTSIGANRLVAMAVSLAASVACAAFFHASRLGLAVRAMMQQRDAAALVGIDSGRINLIVFSLGFAMAGLAGALISMVEQITPFSGFPFTIAAFVVIILGGLGNIAGSLAGGLLLGVVEVYGVALTSSSYRSILIYGVFILILTLRPQGLFGAAR